MKAVSLCLSAGLLTSALASCAGAGNKASDIRFTYSGSTDILSVFGGMVDEFNKTVGKEKNITVKKNPVPESGLAGVLTQRLPSKSGPDVVAILDEAFKLNTKNLMDLTEEFDAEYLDKFYESSASRYRYNQQTTTSNATDPLYGLPFYNDTTVLYYNKTALENQNVICISVEESELDAFNGGAKDHNGKTKADYGIDADFEVPACGFYRDFFPFAPEDGETDASSWQKPSDDELLIFNDRIAMSWDEIEDIGLICTQKRNNSSTTQYGYYTEWWFNYGWSVGGNCLQDITGNGKWTYSLPSDLPNFIVNEGKTYTGKYTGTTYKAGETLEMQDIVAESSSDILDVYFDDQSFYYTVNGQKEEVTSDVLTAEENGVLTELPSIKEAFSRFCYLAGVGGSNVCPYPSQFNSVSSYQFFASGKLGFLVERISNYDYIEKNAKFDFGIARMPVYKEYKNDDRTDEVVAKGKDTYHSFGHCLSIRKTTDKKEKALIFLDWAVNEGQKFFAEQGYFSTRKADREIMLENSKYGNSEIIADSMAEAKAGDWWYMPDRSWIDNWATPLNSSVRYGSLSLEKFLYAYIEVTNQALANYKQ